MDNHVSKKGKLLQKLMSHPAPKDFRWDDLVTLMRWAEFVEKCNGGSHYTFEHKSGFRVQMSKTHPGGILKRYQVEAAKDALKRVGIRGE